MIPYFQQPHLNLGLLTIHGFGVLVALAVISGSALVRRRARTDQLDLKNVERLLSWLLLGGFAGAHLADRLVYFPGKTLADPVSLLRFWDGLSSFGGLVGAVVGALAFIHHARLAALRWRLLDTVAYALPFGWIFGRTGCFIAFDHPGKPTTFFLGQMNADGIVIHNLGLDEALYTVVIAAIFLVLGRRPRVAGFFTGMVAILYAPARFLFDFLRVVDVRYAGLTPGQWGSLALIGLGVFILLRRHSVSPAGAAPPLAA